MLGARDPVEQRAEIAGSRRALEDRLGAPVDVFAYPFGRPRVEYTRTTARLVREAGFDHACAVAPRELTARSPLDGTRPWAPPDVGGEEFREFLLTRMLMAVAGGAREPAGPRTAGAGAQALSGRAAAQRRRWSSSVNTASRPACHDAPRCGW